MIFYTFPATFEKEIAAGFNAKQFAEVLKNAGMLTPPKSGRGYQRKSPVLRADRLTFMCSVTSRRKTASQKNNSSCV
jgi:putative DNA primase/helicase